MSLKYYLTMKFSAPRHFISECLLPMGKLTELPVSVSLSDIIDDTAIVVQEKYVEQRRLSTIRI